MSTPIVLVVDDDDLVRETFAVLLRALSYQVLTAEGGEEALALLENQGVDVILSDQVMPNMTGDQLLREVARRWPDVERILITGFATMDSLIKGVNDGNIGYYLSKPVSQETLTAAIELGVDRTRKRRQLREDADVASRERDRALRLLDEANNFVERLRPTPEQTSRPPLLWSTGGGHLIIEEVLEA